MGPASSVGRPRSRPDPGHPPGLRRERPLASRAVRADAALGAELLDQQKLRSREQEILGLVLEGLTSVAIGQRLMIEMSTVKTHMRSILRKLGVGSRRDLLCGFILQG